MAEASNLEEIAGRIEAISESFADVSIAVGDQGEPTDVTVNDLFTDQFIQAHTEYPTLEAFVRHSPAETDADCAGRRVPDEAVTEYIETCSEFQTYEEMVEAATVAWLEREIGLL